MQYLRKLSLAKRVANNYFLHGRVQRDLPAQHKIAPQSLISIPWLSKDQTSLLIPLTTPTSSEGAELEMTLDLRKYGFNPEDSSKMFNVTQIQAYEGQELK